ncbi:MAG: M1 family metallopeptidase, partial [Pseudomonadota bacterium]
MRTFAALLVAAAAAAAAATAPACGDHSEPMIGPTPLPIPSGKPALRVNGPLSSRQASYQINARLDTSEKLIEATETLVWRNDGVASVDSLPFHLYMNAFKNDSSVFMGEAGGVHRGHRILMGSRGRIDVTSLAINGEELRGTAHFGVDETVLEVPLTVPVAPDESIEIHLSFTTKLPRVFARTGFAGDFVMAGQWFPKIGVLAFSEEGQRWHCEPLHLNGEFFADFGTYDVVLDVPDTLVVAATGVLTSAEPAAEPGRRLLTYRAEDVHDFAWMADPFMQIAKTTSHDGVEIHLYHRPRQARYAGRHLEAARRTIEFMSERLLPYPWPIITVIDPPPEATAAGGMEYPTLVTTAGDVLLASEVSRSPELVTAHEVAHNWFQGIVASNEVDEPWLDEGLTEYASTLVLDHWYGPDRSLFDAAGVRSGGFQLKTALVSDFEIATPIAARSFDFGSRAEYSTVVYARAAL